MEDKSKERPKRKGRFVKGHHVGRPKGSLNIATINLRSMFLEALNRLGGVDWLVTVAQQKPSDFLFAICRLLPKPPDPEPEAIPSGAAIVVFSAESFDAVQQEKLDQHRAAILN